MLLQGLSQDMSAWGVVYQLAKNFTSEIPARYGVGKKIVKKFIRLFVAETQSVCRYFGIQSGCCGVGVVFKFRLKNPKFVMFP